MADTSARLLELLSLLQQRSHWGGPELAERLAVTPRTVRRDVDRLRTLGYPVDAAPGSLGGYRLAIGASLPPLLLTDDEATAIAIALGVSAAGGIDGVREAAVAAMAKLDRVLPVHLRSRIAAVRSTTLSLGGVDQVDAAALLVMAKAAADHERLRLAYVDREGRATERRVDPHRLVSTGRRWYLVAFDVDRADWRTLRVDRVSEVTATGHRFTLVDPPDAVAMVSRASGVAPYRHVAEAVVHADVAVVSAKVPPTVATVTPHPDGALLTVGADDLASLAGHLVSLDLPFEVLSPPALRALLLRAGQRLVATHGPTDR
jgi:predicted DNA-binding transcriptional regulator YafY